MRDKPRWYSILLIGLTLLLVTSITGCGQPNWCNEKLTPYTNYEYGYKLYFPPDASLVTGWEGRLTVFINDEVSIISVFIYTGSFTPSKLAESFVGEIEARNEIGEGEDTEYAPDYPQRWNYEIELDSRKDNFAEIKYTYLKKDIVGIDPIKIETIPIRGNIFWYKRAWQGNHYIYECKYETYLKCEKCNRLLDIATFEFFRFIAKDEFTTKDKVNE